METNIKASIKKAIALAKDTPEPYDKVVVGVVLKHLLETDNVESTRKSHVTSRRQAPSGVDADRLETILRSNYEWSMSNTTKLVGLGQYLNILKIVLDEFTIDDLSSSEIQEILSEKFRISKSINAVSMSLMDAVGKYVDRRRRNNEYFYKITQLGREHLDSLLGKIKDDGK